MDYVDVDLFLMNERSFSFPQNGWTVASQADLKGVDLVMQFELPSKLVLSILGALIDWLLERHTLFQPYGKGILPGVVTCIAGRRVTN